MATTNRYTVLQPVLDDGRTVYPGDTDPTVILTAAQAAPLIALGVISPTPGAAAIDEAEALVVAAAVQRLGLGGELAARVRAALLNAPAAADVRLVTPGLIATHQIVNRLATDANDAANGYTYHVAGVLESHARAIRVGVYNIHSAAVPVSVSVAPTARLTAVADQITPTGAWTPLLFSGASSVSMPARLTPVQPSITWSDWLRLDTLDRDDAGSGIPYMLRFRYPPSALPITRSNYDLTAWASGAFAKGRPLLCFRQAVDGVGAPGNFTSQSLYGYPPGYCLQYRADRPTVSLAIFGDSIHEGAVNGAAGNYGNGYAWQTVSALREMFPQLNVDIADMAQAGITPADCAARALTWMASAGAVAGVQLVVWGVGTPNGVTGGPTQQRFGDDAYYASIVAEQCRALGVPILFTTWAPNTAQGWVEGSLSPAVAGDVWRRQGNARTRAWRQAGALVLDLDAALTDGGQPARYAPGMSDDGTHPSEAGHAAVAAQLVPMLAGMIRRALGGAA